MKNYITQCIKGINKMKGIITNFELVKREEENNFQEMFKSRSEFLKKKKILEKENEDNFENIK